MIKRTIEISRQALHISARHKQLVLQARGQASGDAATVPCEDIGMVVVDEPGVTWSHAALSTLMEEGAVVVVCGRNHLPQGILLPVSGHSEVVSRMGDQLAVKLPQKKQLWRQIVVRKILEQAKNLEEGSGARRRLQQMSDEVRSGDTTNVEAQAAKVYWGAWLGSNGEKNGKRFRRDPEGTPPNNLLNYGYSVMRAALGRALVSAGLQPAIGLHHCNRGNAFCLADDLVEPFRPLVDRRVRDLHLGGIDELSRDAKTALLELLTVPVEVGGESGPLSVSLHRLTASLVRCYRGESRELDIPVPCC